MGFDTGLPFEVLTDDSPFSVQPAVSTESVIDKKPEPKEEGEVSAGGEDKVIPPVKSDETISTDPPVSVDSEKKEEVKPSGDDQDTTIDVKEYTPAARILLQMQRVTKTLPEDVEIKKDATYDEMIEIIGEAALNKYKEPIEEEVSRRTQEVEAKLGDDGKLEEYALLAKQLYHGGNRNVVSAYGQYKAYAEYEPKDEKEVDAIIRASMGTTDKDLVSAYMATLTTKEKRAAALEKAQTTFSNLATKAYEDEELRIKTSKEKLMKDREEGREEVLSVMANNMLPIEVPKEMHTSIVDYVGKFDQVITDGNKNRIQVTRLQKVLGEAFKDVRQLAMLGYIYYNGGPEKFIEKASTAANEDFLKGLDDVVDVTPKTGEHSNPLDDNNIAQSLDFIEKQGGTLLGSV